MISFLFTQRLCQQSYLLVCIQNMIDLFLSFHLETLVLCWYNELWGTTNHCGMLVTRIFLEWTRYPWAEIQYFELCLIITRGTQIQIYGDLFKFFTFSLQLIMDTMHVFLAPVAQIIVVKSTQTSLAALHVNQTASSS